MKVAVVGANGQLGTDLVDALTAAGIEAMPLRRGDLDVSKLDSVRDALHRHRPDVVLNTAAFHNMPECEKDPAQTFAVNAVGALNLARTTADLGVRNVYFSTDYVFDGAKSEPYVETDRPLPLNVYGASKLAGERLSEVYAPGSLVLRVSGLYGRVPCSHKGDNFITKITGLAARLPQVKVVTDEILTPTPTRAIAEKTAELLATDAAGLMHLTCEGACSWHEFTREIFTALEIETPLLEATEADFPSAVKRPSYSVLENSRLASTGLAPMPHWREALREFLAREHAVVNG